MNRRKKLFVVSDIHGYYSILRQSLECAGFRENDDSHLLVCCGDYFDRGSENFQMLKYLDCLENKILLRGNHEDMLLEIFRTGRLKPYNYLNGTLQTITELFGKYAVGEGGVIDFSGKTRVLDRMENLIGEMRDFFETEHYVFTHGWLPTRSDNARTFIDEEWRNASAEAWREARKQKWVEMYDVCNRLHDKTIVCGHVPVFFGSQYAKLSSTENPNIFYGDGVIVLDAGTDITKKINVLVVDDHLYDEQKFSNARKFTCNPCNCFGGSI